MFDLVKFVSEVRNFMDEAKETVEKAKETGEPQYFNYAGEKIQVNAGGELTIKPN